MPDNKQLCKTCKVRHLPPTGKKCKLQKKHQQVESDNELLSDAAVAGQSSAAQTAQGASGDGQLLQLEILQQLKKMTERLDHVEERMASTPGSSTPKSPELSSDSFLQSIKPSKKQKKSKGQSSHGQGKEKFKSMRGGSIDVQVKHRVHWPHEAILGGVTRQRVNYDQLSLTQWVQGFCRHILEESDGGRKDIMVSYLADLMEDTTDFSWQGAKAAHAVLMCEMERGSVKWEDSDRIDRIRRAHAQKHVSHRSNWGKQDNNKKPWFCKNYQTNTCTFAKDHETNGKLHRHICAYCLNLGKQLTHSEKNCITKQQQVKNEQTAAHH